MSNLYRINKKFKDKGLRHYILIMPLNLQKKVKHTHEIDRVT